MNVTTAVGPAETVARSRKGCMGLRIHLRAMSIYVHYHHRWNQKGSWGRGQGAGVGEKHWCSMVYILAIGRGSLWPPPRCAPSRTASRAAPGSVASSKPTTGPPATPIIHVCQNRRPGPLQHQSYMKRAFKSLHYRSWIRAVFCTRHLERSVVGCKTHLKSRCLALF